MLAAVIDGTVVLVGNNEEPHQVTQVGDINLNLGTVRLQRPGPPTCDICGQATDECSCSVGPTCDMCGKAECECTTPPLCAKCGHSPCQCPNPPTPRQVNFNATASLDSEKGREDQVYLLRQLSNFVEDGRVRFINQMAQLVVDDQETADTIKQVAEEIGLRVNTRKV